MPEDVQTLKCPACGATLDPPQGQSSMKCSYCQSTVEIPAAVRAPASAPFPYDANIGKIPGAGPLWREDQGCQYGAGDHRQHQPFGRG